MALATDNFLSKAKIQEIIDLINIALDQGAIASAGGSVTTALSDLAAERDKH
jgi:hypothetical protein